MHRVLITGASGFIGGHLLNALDRNRFSIHGIRHRKTRHSEGLEWHVADLFDPAAVDDVIRRVRPTHLVHLAWVTTPGYLESSENIRWIAAGAHLLESFVAGGGQRAIVAGTCAEYDWTSGECNESQTPLIPATPYGQAKSAFRLAAEAIAERNGLSLAWPRIFLLYGPGERAERLLPGAIRSFQRREHFSVSFPQRRRDYLYVRDLAEALARLLDSSVCGSINVASGIAISLGEMVRQAAKRMNAEDLLTFATPVDMDPEPLLIADISRIRQELGWSPRYDWEQGLEETIRWWLNHWRQHPA